MLVWKWYCDVVVIGCLRGKESKRGRRRKRNSKKRIFKEIDKKKKRIWDVKCVEKLYGIIDKVVFDMVK